jgi:hypothetical protein
MEVEFSNFEQRSIPKSCPAELRAKIQAAREGRTVPAEKQDPEGWELLKEFAAIKP